MSPEFFDKLLDAGAIPQHNIGNDRRVYLRDVMAYGKTHNQERAAALDRMSQAAAQMGLYDRNEFPDGGQDE